MKDITTIVTAKLQTAVLPATLEFLRIESVRRHLTMGQLLDEMVGLYTVPESIS